MNGNAVDQVFAEDDATKTLTDPARVLFTVDDNLGSTRGLINNTGSLVTHYAYTPYGAPTSGNTALTPFLYAGGIFDPATGMQYK